MGFFVTFKKLLYTIEATGWEISLLSNNSSQKFIKGVA